MLKTENIKSKAFIGQKRKNISENLKIFKDTKSETKEKTKENGIIQITYKLDDRRLFKDNKYIKLFGEIFVKTNKNKANIIISEKEYEIISMIDIEEFDKYGINKENETLTVILKGEKITDMGFIFWYCISLINVDFSLFNTKNITNMEAMFKGCQKLTQLDLLSFNTQNVTNMSCMFSGCESLIKLDLSSFNTQNVTNMKSMFCDCKNLIKVDLSSFNIQNVTNFSSMFYGCKSLIKINLLILNNQDLINMSSMFYGCKNLIKVDLSSFNTKNLIDIPDISSRCESLIKLDLSPFNTQNMTAVYNDMFLDCPSLIKIKRKNLHNIKIDLELEKRNISIIEV